MVLVTAILIGFGLDESDQLAFTAHRTNAAHSATLIFKRIPATSTPSECVTVLGYLEHDIMIIRRKIMNNRK